MINFFKTQYIAVLLESPKIFKHFLIAISPKKIDSSLEGLSVFLIIYFRKNGQYYTSLTIL